MASRCFPETIAIERDLLRDGVFKLKDMQTLINKPVRASLPYALRYGITHFGVT